MTTAPRPVAAAVGIVPVGLLQTPQEANGDEGSASQPPKKPVKTLFDWRVGPEIEGEESDEEEPLATDRPDFVEASSNVGRGRVQLEMGYTYIEDRENGVRIRSHSYPEMLLRIGLFADWFELRIGQNFGNELTRAEELEGSHGSEDLYLGIGLALTEQKGFWPESRILLQMTVPTGSDDFTGGQVLPGFNYLYGWDINDFLSAGASTQLNRAHDSTDHTYWEFAQAVTFGFSFTEKLGMYVESFAFFPSGSNDPEVGPEYYADSGFTYKITPNFQVDIRAGVGLNRRADDFFAGSGFAVRY